MITNVDGPTAAAQSGSSPWSMDQVSLGESVGADAGLLAENCGCGRGRGEADHLAAILGPGQGQGPHGGRLPGASRGDRNAGGVWTAHRVEIDFTGENVKS